MKVAAARLPHQRGTVPEQKGIVMIKAPHTRAVTFVGERKDLVHRGKERRKKTGRADQEAKFSRPRFD